MCILYLITPLIITFGVYWKDDKFSAYIPFDMLLPFNSPEFYAAEYFYQLVVGSISIFFYVPTDSFVFMLLTLSSWQFHEEAHGFSKYCKDSCSLNEFVKKHHEIIKYVYFILN